jgi:hypothetical protein
MVLSTYHAADITQLRADIAAVNNTSGPNTIILEGRTYKDLNSPLQIQNAGNLTIQGSAGKHASATQLVGGVSSPIFEIQGGNVTISRILMSGEGIVTRGGVIDAENTNLTLQRSTVNGGAAVQAGGGIFQQGGTLNITDCSIVNNMASGAENSFGGGIATVNTNVNISGTRIANNTLSQINNMNPGAGALASGGGVYAQGGTLNISRTNLSNNKVTASTSGTTAIASGGGLATVNATASVDRSVLANNSLYTIASQSNTSQGSAFSSSGGKLAVTNSQISGNLPNGKSEFAGSDAVVVLQASTVDDVVLPGKYTLGNNGFTPET